MNTCIECDQPAVRLGERCSAHDAAYIQSLPMDELRRVHRERAITAKAFFAALRKEG